MEKLDKEAFKAELDRSRSILLAGLATGKAEQLREEIDRVRSVKIPRELEPK